MYKKAITWPAVHIDNIEITTMQAGKCKCLALLVVGILATQWKKVRCFAIYTSFFLTVKWLYSY